LGTEKNREQELKEAYDEGFAAFGTFQKVAKNDLKACIEHAWTPQDIIKAGKQKRELKTFPMIHRVVNWISGYQREHQLSPKYEPVENADDMTAGQLTEIALWVYQYANAYHTISDAFEFSLKTGINLINVYNDRNMNTKFDRFAYNQFIIDPNFRRRDLKDCHYGIMRRHVTRQAAEMLFPGQEKFIAKLVDESGTKVQEGNSEMFPNFARPVLLGNKLLAVDEFQQRTTKRRKSLIIRPTNQEIEWTGTNAELDRLLQTLIGEMGMPASLISVISRHYDTVDVTSYLEGQEVMTSRDPYGIGDFSFTPVIAYFNPDHDRMEIKVQSIVRSLVDSQRASDSRMMSMTSVFDQQAGVGVDAEEGAFVDDEDLFATEPGRSRLLTKDAIAQNRYKDRVINDIPAGMFQLHDMFNKMMPLMVNVNEDMFGQAPKGNMQIAGFLSKLRVGMGVIGQQGLFHNLGLSDKIIAGKVLKLIQQYPLDKVRRIISQQPAPSFYNKEFGKYDSVAAEAMLSDTQRNQAYAELVALKQLGTKVGDPFPAPWSIIIKHMPLESKAKQDLIKQIEQTEQQAQQQQAKQQQTQDMMQQLAIQQAQAQMLENRAQAEERRTQSVENTTGAALDRVNTMVKTQSLQQETRIKPIMELLNFTLELEKIKQQNVSAEAKS